MSKVEVKDILESQEVFRALYSVVEQCPFHLMPTSFVVAGFLPFLHLLGTPLHIKSDWPTGQIMH
jgi:hypothetical protein